MAEFFRLGLLAGICEVCAVQRWADDIVAADAKPHIAFIELCISGTQPSAAVQALLSHVPGQAASDLPVHMLLGHASRLLAAGVLAPQQLLLHLYRIASRRNFPERIYFDLVSLEDALSLARDEVYGTMPEVSLEIARFLVSFESCAPDIL